MKVFDISIDLCFECYQTSSISFSYKTVCKTAARLPGSEIIESERKRKVARSSTHGKIITRVPSQK